MPAIASIPARSLFQEAHPIALEGTRLRIEFPRSASFHRNLAGDEKNSSQLAEALYELTGARLSLEFVIAEAPVDVDEPVAEAEPPPGNDLISLLKDEFDAREVEE